MMGIRERISNLCHGAKQPPSPENVAKQVQEHVQTDEAQLSTAVAIAAGAERALEQQCKQASSDADKWHQEALGAQTQAAAELALKNELKARRTATTLQAQIDKQRPRVDSSQDNLETRHLQGVETTARGTDLVNRHRVADADNQMSTDLDKAKAKLNAAEDVVNGEEARSEFQKRTSGAELDEIARTNDVAKALELLQKEKAANAGTATAPVPPPGPPGGQEWIIAH